MNPPTVTDHRVTAAFDRAAPGYDASFESLPGTRALRRRILRILRRCFRPGDRVLELNAGTGTDAIALAASGVTVHATDVSPAMIDILRKKVRDADLESRVTAEVRGFADLGALNRPPFDGLLSDFGGINCTADLGALARDCARLVSPGGLVVLVFMSRFCLWETTAFLLRGDVRSAFRRSTPGPVNADVHGTGVGIWYHSPEILLRVFAAEFTEVTRFGLSVITPPPGSVRSGRVLRPLLPLLHLLETFIGKLPLARDAGDHTLMVLRRREPPAGEGT